MKKSNTRSRAKSNVVDLGAARARRAAEEPKKSIEFCGVQIFVGDDFRADEVIAAIGFVKRHGEGGGFTAEVLSRVIADEAARCRGCAPQSAVEWVIAFELEARRAARPRTNG